MSSNKVKSFIKRYWIFYFLGFIIVFGIKYFYSKASSDDLDWILAPTARWVRILSGIPFEKEPQIGYINHHFRFIIAPSCSGVQFMTITFATLLYSFVHRMGTMKKGFCWMALSLGFSYLFTIFVNGFRIIFSIYLLPYFHKPDVDSGWMTAERIHTIEGTVVYFASLFIIYHIAGYVSQKIERMHSEQQTCSCIPPMFWYFSITLGIPFLNNAYKIDSGKFIEYAMLMTATCLATIFLFYLVSILRKHSGSRRKS